MKEVKLPLKNKNIIITRAKDQVSEVKKMFQQEGAIIYDLPALIIDYPKDIKPLDNALEGINDFHWVIFSSANGIKFVEKRLSLKGTSLKEFSNKLKIAVVGDKTSQYLNKIGLKADYIPPKFIGDSLVENFPVPLQGLRLLIPRVESGGRRTIIDDFITAGAIVTAVAAYESKCPSVIPQKTINAFQNKIIDAILFSSGKTVKNTSKLLKMHFGEEWKSMLSDIKFLTIGPQTTLACQKEFGRVDKQANQYNFQGLLESSIDYFS